MTDRSGIGAAFTSPYVLCAFAILFWSGNFIAARLANLDVPPVALSFWRHALAAAMALPFAFAGVRRDWPVIRERPGLFLVLTFLFVAGNTFVYFCVLHTTVINAALMNAGLPVVAVFFSWVILRDLINRWQALGIVLSFLGLAAVVTRADPGVLASFDFRLGDLYMLLAITCWALYMVLFKRATPKISPWSLLLVLCVGGTVWLIPAYALEIVTGATMKLTVLTGASIVYVALFSTILAWTFWNIGTLRIGPNRAAAFMNLHPIFGSALAMIFLGEVLQAFHVAGTGLVLIGVFLVSRSWAAQRVVREGR